MAGAILYKNKVYGQGADVSKKYGNDDGTEATLADDDKVPFYDTSATANKNSTWANIKAKLKAYFDTIYSTFSGAYADLTGKPTLGTAAAKDTTNSYSSSGTDPITGTGVAAALGTLDVTGDSNIAASKTIKAWSETDGKVSITTQDISITKSQISDFPTIPTVNNGTLTIQKNGTNVATFTANQSGNSTANISVPTGDLASINKDGTSSTKYLRGDGTWQAFPSIPAAQVQSDWTQTTTTAVDYIKNKPNLATVATSGSYNDLSDKPTIPTNTDEKVKQENTTGSADYRVLLSNGANDTTETKTARKSTNLKFNPSTGNLQATQLNGVTIGSSPKFTDNNTTYTLSADTTNNQIKLTPSSGTAQAITVPYATSAYTTTNIGSVTIGAANKGIYVFNGAPVACSYAVNKDVPADAVFTDTNNAVTQTATTTANAYEILFSGTADNTTRTEGARKTSTLTYNPSTKTLTNSGGGIFGDYADYKSGSYHARVQAESSFTASRTFYFPKDAGGTLATREYLNSNKYLKNAYSTLSSKTVTNGQSLDLSSFADTDLLYIHFNRYGHQGYVFGFKGSLGGSNGMRILFGSNYFITLSNPSDNTNNLKIQTDSAFPNIVCNVWKLA